LAARPISVAQIITGTAAALAMLYFFRGVLVPFVVAFVLAVLVSALVRWVGARAPRAPDWAVALIAGLIVISAASGGIFVMGQGMAQMAEQGPALADRIDGLLLDAGRGLHLKQALRLSTLVGNVSIAQIAGFVLSNLQGLASGVLLMIVYFGFILAGRRRIARKIDHLAGSGGGGRTIRTIVERIASDIETYVWIQTITGLMLTAASAIVMLAVGLHNVLFWSVVFFLLTFIPNIGVTVGSIAPALFALLQFPTVWQAVVIFVAIQVVATVVGNLIYPRLQAATQNIDPVATILSLAFWTLLWGLAGAFLAVPMTLMTMMVFAQFPQTKWIAVLLSNDGKVEGTIVGRKAPPGD
jgi:AI-2 transport protein TqsA